MYLGCSSAELPLTDEASRPDTSLPDPFTTRHVGKDARSSSRCTVIHVETIIDAMGRIVVPKPLLVAVGLQPGATVDITAYGAGLQVLPAGRTARIVQVDGTTVARSDTPVTDDVVYGLIDSLRR